MTSTRLRLAVAALAIVATFPVRAQLTPQQDPANLAGERVSAPDLADTLPIDHGAPALQQLLRKLRTRASFMLIVAHPDDEDGGMLTYLSRGQGARVATLTLNRGEGGQNLMSADFGDALGLIRTQELLAADRYMGVDQLFGTEVDFGFSKTKEEAFAKWTHDRVLYDAVRAIRLYRPLVIASVFIGAPSDGHGQHQVSGEIAQEAFKAAGDPNVFPDQIAAGLQPWQPLKVYARSPFARIDEHGMYDYATSAYVPPRFTNYVTGKVTEALPKANVVVPEGTPDPLLGGLSYLQFAREGLALQRSQIGSSGHLASPGRFDVGYHRYGSCVTPNSGCPIHRDSAMSGLSDASKAALSQLEPAPEFEGLESSFFDGIDTSIEGIASLAPHLPTSLRTELKDLSDAISQAASVPDGAGPQRGPVTDQEEKLIAPLLLEACKHTDAILAAVEATALPQEEKVNILHELRIKRVQLNNALVLAHTIKLQAYLADNPSGQDVLTTQRSIQAVLELSTSSSTDSKNVHLDSLELVTSDGHRATEPPPDKGFYGHIYGSTRITLAIPEGLPATRPYFHRIDTERPLYVVDNWNLLNAPATPAPITVEIKLNDNGTPLIVAATVQKRWNSGQAANVVPPVSVSIHPSLAILPVGREDEGISFETQVTASAPGVHGDTGFGGLFPSDTFFQPYAGSFNLEHVGDQKVLPTKLFIPKAHPAPQALKPWSVTASAMELPSHDYYSEGFRPVGYPGLTSTNYYTPATARIIPIDVHTAPHLNVAYLPGTGDDIPAALENLGIQARTLTLADLNLATLQKYDAVILGVRAYTAHPELTGAGSQPLLDYARSGGVVIVQFNNGRYGEAEAPYPITVASSSGDHSNDVIDESSPIRILAPNSPLLNWPNRITTADFDNWVEERGHSFAGSWASQYQPLIETHDPNQEPQRGGLLVAPTGKGYYIYCGLALYRQFPEGVPGAYRLLANLVSAAKHPTK